MRLAIALLFVCLTAIGQNLIPNSSFECGTENWFCYGSDAGERYGNVSSASGRLSPTNKVHGNNSIMWKTRIFTQPIRLLAGNYVQTYSGMANISSEVIVSKANGGGGTAVPAAGTYIAPETNGLSHPVVMFGTSMARYTNFITVVSNDFYSFKWYGGDSGELVWLDAVQLETGTVASAYAPLATVETGLGTTNINHILHVATPNSFQLKCWNEGGTVGMTSVVQVYDFENTNIMAATAISTNALVAGATTINISLPGRVGWMRATSYQPTIDKSWSELLFFVRPYAPPSVNNTNGIIGSHPTASEYGVQRDRELGYSWSRGLSPANLIAWSLVQPHGSGPFIWNDPTTYMDGYVDLFRTNGTVPLLCLAPGCDPISLNCDGYWPRDATNGVPVQANINAWSNFCYQASARYSASPYFCWTYEIGNEWHNIVVPTDFNNASNRARFIVAGAQAVKAACPTCTVVGISGESVYANGWETWTNMTAPEQAVIDVISAHLYPIGQGNSNPNVDEDDWYLARSVLGWARTFAGTGKPLWNTEMGNQGLIGGNLGPLILNSIHYPTYYQVVPEAGRDYGMGQRKVVPVNREARQVIRTLGAGFQKVFVYGSRGVDDDIWSGRYTDSTMEFSGAVKQGSAAALIAANYFIRNPGLGRITNSAGSVNLSIEAYLFTNALGSVIAVWCSDQLPRTLTLSSGNFGLFEVMGNPIATNTTVIDIGRTPRYLVSGDLTTAQLKTAFTNATVTTNADVTGPNISVDVTPTGVVTNGTHFFKWTLTDKNKQAWSIGAYASDNTNNRSRVKFYDSDTWRDMGESNHVFVPMTITAQYNLIVEGKDFYNNVTVATGPAFGILGAPPAAPTSSTMNVSTLNVGTITVVAP